MLDRHNLHSYQNKGVEHGLEYSHAALFKEMGLGKTVTTLTLINTLIYEELEISSVLIIAPKRVAENVWTSEIKKWAHLNHLTTSRVTGTAKQRKHALKVKADIYLIGRDNVAWLCGQYGGSMLPFDMLVIDESSSFKNHRSKRFTALKRVQPSFARVLLLTGTPAPNGLLDLWAQIYLLDRGERLGKFISHYRQAFFRNVSKSTQYSKFKIVGDGEQRIYDRIQDICLSMKAEDYLELPGRIVNDIKITFPPALAKKYRDFEREQVLELLNELGEEKDVTAANAAALSGKLRQFSNGAVYASVPFGMEPPRGDAREVLHIHDLKLDAAEEIVEAAQGKPVLIGWAFRHDRNRLLKRLKKYGVKCLDKEEDIDAWNRGEIPVMLMHPASGGHGLNLQAGGNILLWFGPPWSLELYQQFNARLDRQGQLERVFIHRLIVEGTIDEEVIASLERKDKKQDGLMVAVRARLQKYRNAVQ